MVKKLIEEELEEEELEEEEEEKQEKRGFLKKKTEEAKHMPGDIEEIYEIVGYRVWKNDKEFIDIPLNLRGLAEIYSVLLKALQETK